MRTGFTEEVEEVGRRGGGMGRRDCEQDAPTGTTGTTGNNGGGPQCPNRVITALLISVLITVLSADS